MRLAESGDVFAHFIIPFVDEDRARQQIAKGLEAHRKVMRRNTLTSIAGECDLLLHLQLPDFRQVADLHEDLAEAHSHATSWLYAVAYDDFELHLGPEEVEFFIYLRVHRSFYAAYGRRGEEELCARIRELLRDESRQLSGRLLYSLGWPDLVVHGRLAAEMGDLQRLIAQLQTLAFTTATPGRILKRPQLTQSPIFLKTITLLGIPLPLTGRLPPADVENGVKLQRPVLLGRSRPGLGGQALNAAIQALKDGGAVPSVESCALDGTWDFVIAASPASDPIRVRRLYDAFHVNREAFVAAGVERTQTHLLTAPAAEWASLTAEQVLVTPAGDPDSLPRHRCTCTDVNFADLRNALKQLAARERLPKPLLRTISHVLEMFRHTLRDTSNCCDCVGALRAHAEGLGLLLNLLVRTRERLDDAAAGRDLTLQAFLANEISLINAHLAEWCRRAGRVVREKTAASSARLFLQVDSVVAQRGAVPKILMLAERMMHDFYAHLPDLLHRSPATARRTSFAAILEPQGNVTSNQPMGLVSIPLRYAFALHLVVPQLWHEVGQYVFWAQYYLEQEGSATESPPTEEGLQATVDREFQIAYNLRGDMFADLLVYCVGFHHNLLLFMRYLGSLTANVARHDKLHVRSWEQQVVALVQRLCFVHQFETVHQLMKGRAFDSEADFRHQCRVLQGDMVASPGGHIHRLIDYLQNLDQSGGWPSDFKIPGNLIETVRKNCQSAVYGMCLEDMTFLAYVFRDGTPVGEQRLDASDWARVAEGELVDLRSATVLQGAYREFYARELDAQLAGEAGKDQRATFREMATLGRSALLHVYQHEGEPLPAGR